MRCLRCRNERKKKVRRVGRYSAGFTLLEVLVGLAIMASVLVSSLLAFAAHQRARRLAEAKLAAVGVADELLFQLSGGRGGIPPTSRGVVPGRNDWWWQTELVGLTAPAGIPMSVVRFRIVEATASGKQQTLVSVDIVKGAK
ncbi:MAG: prepilin-type N-terminal cleavage/methylation domain-containing protein [Rubripirellula sp.]